MAVVLKYSYNLFLSLKCVIVGARESIENGPQGTATSWADW